MKSNMVMHSRQHYGVKPYKCGYCQRMFSRKGNCVDHERRHLKIKYKLRSLNYIDQLCVWYATRPTTVNTFWTRIIRTYMHLTLWIISIQLNSTLLQTFINNNKFKRSIKNGCSVIVKAHASNYLAIYMRHKMLIIKCQNNWLFQLIGLLSIVDKSKTH